jgi:hypothetical protein
MNPLTIVQALNMHVGDMPSTPVMERFKPTLVALG